MITKLIAAAITAAFLYGNVRADEPETEADVEGFARLVSEIHGIADIVIDRGQGCQIEISVWEEPRTKCKQFFRASADLSSHWPEYELYTIDPAMKALIEKIDNDPSYPVPPALARSGIMTLANKLGRANDVMVDVTNALRYLRD